MDYFKQLGKEITEEELDTLKQSYNKAQESSGTLTLQQLDDVAGGIVFISLRDTLFYSPYCEVFINREGCLSLRSSGTRGEELTEAVPFFNARNPVDVIMVSGSRAGETFTGRTTELTSDEVVNPLFDFRNLRNELNSNETIKRIQTINEHAHNPIKITNLCSGADRVDPILFQDDGTYTINPGADIYFITPTFLPNDELSAVRRSLEELTGLDAAEPGHEFNRVYMGLRNINDTHNLNEQRPVF